MKEAAIIFVVVATAALSALIGYSAGARACPELAAANERLRLDARDRLESRMAAPSDEHLVCAAILEEAETYLRARDRLDALSSPG